MKKIYSYFNTLICFSFLFILNSCSASTSLVLSSTLGSLAEKCEINYYSSIKDNAIPVNGLSLYDSTGRIPNELFVAYSTANSFLENNVKYLIKTETAADIDPDWWKLITHFSRRIKEADQKR